MQLTPAEREWLNRYLRDEPARQRRMLRLGLAFAVASFLIAGLLILYLCRQADVPDRQLAAAPGMAYFGFIGAFLLAQILYVVLSLLPFKRRLYKIVHAFRSRPESAGAGAELHFTPADYQWQDWYLRRNLAARRILCWLCVPAVGLSVGSPFFVVWQLLLHAQSHADALGMSVTEILTTGHHAGDHRDWAMCGIAIALLLGLISLLPFLGKIEALGGHKEFHMRLSRINRAMTP